MFLLTILYRSSPFVKGYAESVTITLLQEMKAEKVGGNYRSPLITLKTFKIKIREKLSKTKGVTTCMLSRFPV